MVVGELQSTPGGPGQKYTKLSVESRSLALCNAVNCCFQYWNHNYLKILFCNTV